MKKGISGELFQAIIDSLPVHLYWTDKGTHINGANILQARNFGDQTVQDCLGKSSYDFAKQLGWTKEFADALNAEHLSVINTGKGTVNEYTGVLADGKEHTFLSQKQPLKVKNEVVGLVGISVDITERKNMEKALEKAKEKAEAANEAKTLFVQNMEHDLRTPSSGIAQMIELLEDKEADTEKRELLGHIKRASKQLLELINSILEFDQITHRDTPVLYKKFDIRELVSNIIDIEQPTAISKNLELILKCADNVPNIILGDGGRLYRILLNLVTNAVKFTPKGFVKIIVQIAKRIDEKRFLLKFVIQDTGVGIPADKQNIIYERFTRCTPSNQGIYPGSGLGLCIVRQLIAELEGEIEVESKLGRGSAFTVLLPFELPLIDVYKSGKAESKQIKTIKNSSELKILLVEDDILAQRIASSLLSDNFQCQVDIAESGKKAIKMIQSQEYDLAFMDLGLPDISGYDVTKKIRKLGFDKLPIIALTAHRAALVEKETKKAGANDFITKPLSVDKAVYVIGKWCAKNQVSDKSESDDKSSNQTSETKDIKIDEFTVSGNVIDLEDGAKRIGGDAKGAKEMLDMLTKGFDADLPKLIAAKEKKDWAGVKDIVHKMKGGSLYCGVPRLQQMCTYFNDYLVGSQKKLRNKLYKQLLDEIEKVQQAAIEEL